MFIFLKDHDQFRFQANLRTARIPEICAFNNNDCAATKIGISFRPKGFVVHATPRDRPKPFVLDDWEIIFIIESIFLDLGLA